MPKTVSTGDPRGDLTGALALAGTEVRQKYGSSLNFERLQVLLQDRSVVKYPCEMVFDSRPLLAGEFAHTMRRGLAPEDGFIIYVHPSLHKEQTHLPYIVLHQLPAVNLNGLASPDQAEEFGSSALGLSRESYYQKLCEIAGHVGGDDLV